MNRSIRWMLSLAMLAVALPAGAQDSDCDFDQAYFAKRMQQIAARHGGRLDATGTAIWKLRNGETITVASGGCVHYGTTVSLVYAPGASAPSREVAIDRLFATVSKYWQPAAARRLQALVRTGAYQTRTLDDGSTELVGSLDPGQGFSFEYRLILGKHEVRISWEEA
ncbi:hypothetical protein [Lysobacter antibioticus]|uniref:Uncharacterized protein n=1 Tax=Lysobacter antibioticus TaxID=84531 RepID=A0A0S2F4K9_LYSAN|nr:hypothetical protein [Lysobacter antibioticus]ALN78337.1 hypothetical protein LA76x_0175 [Lysobacter antibioticus]